jgi:hypothetical protein
MQKVSAVQNWTYLLIAFMKRSSVRHSQLNSNSIHLHRTVTLTIKPSVLNIYLFTVCVTTLSVAKKKLRPTLKQDSIMKHKWPWPKFKQFIRIWLQGLKKVTLKPSHTTTGFGPKTYRKKQQDATHSAIQSNTALE